MCNLMKTVWTVPPGAENNINTEAVIAIMSIGGGYSNLREMFSAMDLSTMSRSTYSNEHAKVCAAWKISALKSMEEAAAEEKRLTIERGDVDIEGVLYFAVVADGSWAKRSYKTNYSSLSGMIRLNAYKAVANPTYTCQVTDDPILYCFEIDREMETCSDMDKEFKVEYEQLGTEVRDFTVVLLS
ncbi:hypothetical protein JTE90_006725 [Oedothorax gibbosus]|uniref:Transient receptor ion channel domain-containing protein n=1 Tax=Oedothorax gibbosus TaxID=931172 RepID=A0AAV6TK65_9ARAC|nr:hypothetical protein JTE90_006725 [Oedothorax gibbosus]